MQQCVFDSLNSSPPAEGKADGEAGAVTLLH
jgi:hypothetical protein